MNSKFYVSLETARVLKEKGYRERYHAYYFGDSNLRKGGYRGDSWYDSPDFYPAPTKSEVIDWLESKGIVVQTIPSTPNIWRWRMSSMKYIPYDDHTEDSEILYSTRLETEEAAIIKACKLLENGN